jgi:hypothetical protein
VQYIEHFIIKQVVCGKNIYLYKINSLSLDRSGTPYRALCVFLDKRATRGSLFGLEKQGHQ